MTMHKFKVGQAVALAARWPAKGPRGEYTIVARLPADSRGPQYRIKSRAEPHERIAPEDELTAPGQLR